MRPRLRSRDLGNDPQGHPFLRLDTQVQDIRGQRDGRFGVEQNLRDVSELYRHLRRPFQHGFAGTEVKGDSGPSPVLNEQFERHIGLRRRVGMNAGLVAVPRHLYAVNFAMGVLRTDREPFHILARDRAEAAQDINPRIAHHVRVQRVGRFHGHEAQQLKQMVLHHVPEGAGLFVIRGASPHPFGLADRDLDMVDGLRVPDGLEDAVGKTEHHDVLNRLFSQVVIDPENLGFIEHFSDDGVDVPGRLEIASDRFLHDHAAEGAGAIRRMS